MDAANQPNYAEMRPVDQDQYAFDKREAAMKDEADFLPVASPSEEVTEQDFHVLLRIASDPNATQGRLRIEPRRIPIRQHETVNT